MSFRATSPRSPTSNSGSPLGADDTGAAPDINEAQQVEWIPLDEAVERIACGEIVGAASVVGITQTKMIREAERRAQAAEPR